MKKYLNWHKIHSNTAFEIGRTKASFSFIVILFLITATIKEETTEKLKALMSFAIARKHKVLKKSKSLRMFGKKRSYIWRLGEKTTKCEGWHFDLQVPFGDAHCNRVYRNAWGLSKRTQRRKKTAIIKNSWTLPASKKSKLREQKLI